MAKEQVFGGVDIRGKNYSGPPAQDVTPTVEDAEMVDVLPTKEEEVPVLPTQAPRFECASL